MRNGIGNADIVEISIEDLGIDRDDLEMRIRQQIKPGDISIQRVSDLPESERIVNCRCGGKELTKWKSLIALSRQLGCSVGDLLVLSANDTVEGSSSESDA